MIEKISQMTIEERKDFIQTIKQKHLKEIDNPKVNKEDDFYKDSMVLLVQQKSNWHLYYDPENDCINSIAVVPSAKSSTFGSKAYFKRWYNYTKYNNKKTMLCLTEKAIELLDLKKEEIK